MTLLGANDAKQLEQGRRQAPIGAYHPFSGAEFFQQRRGPISRRRPVSDLEQLTEPMAARQEGLAGKSEHVHQDHHHHHHHHEPEDAELSSRATTPQNDELRRPLAGRRRSSTSSGRDRDWEGGGREQTKRSLLDRVCLLTWRACVASLVVLAVNLLVYFAPFSQRHTVEPKPAPYRPRPKFVGALAVNEQLDLQGEKLWENQFHAPESMAWSANKRRFFTGVEGGFVLLVEPYAERWTVAARLNARLAVEDQSRGLRYEGEGGGGGDEVDEKGRPAAYRKPADLYAPFCERDVQLYGRRAEVEPALVKLSRCSRPLGIRLSPDESRLYVMDPLSGLFSVQLAANLTALEARTEPLAHFNRVTKLIDFTQTHQRAEELGLRPERPEEIYFGDDIAVEFNESDPNEDVIYFSDCSRRWPLRRLIWLMMENDDSGRVMRFHVGSRQLAPLTQVTPVGLDERKLSFPNGLELSANGSALLISDLNNRRILMHHLRGELAGQTRHLLWVPGYPDNIKRGLDGADGRPTYWFGCGCAVSDGRFELAETFNSLPWAKRLLLHWTHLVGSTLDLLGRLTDSVRLRDAGLELSALWLTGVPFCAHSFVGQFNEQGEIVRSLHGPKLSSSFKLISEASQVPALSAGSGSGSGSGPNSSASWQEASGSTRRSTLYLGSVYYSYLGRVELDEEPAALGALPARAQSAARNDSVLLGDNGPG